MPRRTESVCGQIPGCLRYPPDSTPTTEVNSSASLLGTPLAPFPASAFFLSASLVPGITRVPFTGAFVVVNVAALILLSTACVWTRASRMTGSFKSTCSVSGWLDSTKYLLCFRTSLTLPYESVRSRMKVVILSGTGTFVPTMRLCASAIHFMYKPLTAD